MAFIIDSIANLANSVITRIWPDKTEQEKAQFSLLLQQEMNAANLDLEQSKVNEAQASNPNLFVAGARPFIMWGLGAVVVFYGLFTVITNVMIAWRYPVVVMPPLDPMVRDIVLGLLGLGTVARSYEKYKGVQNNH